jgi:hypothetical protein
MKRILIFLVGFSLSSLLVPLYAAGEGGSPPAQNEGSIDQATLQALKTQVTALKAEYDQRIKDLESQIEALQLQLLRGGPEAEAPTPSAQQAAPTVQSVPGALNPAMTVVGNFVGQGNDMKIYNAEGNRIDNKMNLREVELDLRAAIDPYADGVIITSLGSDTPGSYSASVEEAYATIKKLPFVDRMPLGLKLQVGHFRPSIGTDNVLHTHDLPQTFRPLPIQEFLGDEGFTGNGVSGSFFLPTPWSRKSSLNATLQFIDGGNVALSPDVNSRNAYIAHFSWFNSIRDTQSVQVGFSGYYHPAGNSVDQADFYDLDFTYRWKPLRRGEWQSLVLSGEFLFARHAYPGAEEPPEVATALAGTPPGEGKPVGFTAFGQWQFNRRLYAGVRWDRTDVLYNPSLTRRSVTPYISYYFSEFLRFRLNYEHRWSDLYTENGRDSIIGELNFVFGSHPPEPYWVNR